jgi:hypothetical protein
MSPEQKEKWLRKKREMHAANPARRAQAMLARDAAELRRLLKSGGLPQPLVDHYVERLKEPGALAAALAWNQVISLDALSEVPPVLTPSLLIWSEGSPVTRTAAEATRDYVHGRFTEVALPDGCDFLLEISPEALIEPLREHLRSS